MTTRRAFLKVLGGTIAAAAAAPVTRLVPAAPVLHTAPAAFGSGVVSWWDEANIIAFTIHAHSGMPTHPEVYQQRAAQLIQRVGALREARMRAGL